MEGHVGSIDTLENIVGFEFYICDEDDATSHKACVCGQVRRRRDMSDQLTRSIRLMQSNRANRGAFYTATKVSLMVTMKMMLMVE